ncbi:MAG: ketopantoate reductase family protein [Dethiosulfatibacter sp.]|nr:ketopantoate reductase family protein [Dethiosulfatibacter sp.]
MRIEKVAIIGLGSLGILYAHHFLKRMEKENLRIIADKKRIERYKSEGIYCNGEYCDFNYVDFEEKNEPVDLAIFSVKFGGLDDAINMMRNQIGKDTIILSTLNGIISEKVIGKKYGDERIVHCVAQGMDAAKLDNELIYKNKGILCFGDLDSKTPSKKVKEIADFFERVELPYEIDNNMEKRMWGKFMLNVGVNQTVAVYETNYEGIQKEGEARQTMIAAMREVIGLSKKEGKDIGENDLEYWLKILDTLSPEGTPSMRQDMMVNRHSEVELFSGTVIELGKKHNVKTPVNVMLYKRIKEMEAEFH